MKEKEFIAIWGKGYTIPLPLKDQEFATDHIQLAVVDSTHFTEDDGCTPEDIAGIAGLKPGQRLCIDDSGELTIIRTL